MSIKSKRIFQGDPVIWVVFFLLCMISLVEVFSAASTLSFKTGDYMAPLIKQVLFLSIGTCVVWIFHSIPCRYFRIIPITCYPICFLLLIVTLLMGSNINEGSRWLSLFGISFQPSELAKGVLVISVAFLLSLKRTEEGANDKVMKVILIFSMIFCFLIFTENLSTAVILFTTIFLMMFIGRVPGKQLGKVVLGGLGFISLLVLIAVVIPESSLKDTPLERLATWKNRIVGHTEGNGEAELDSTSTVRLTRIMAKYDEEMSAQDSMWGKTKATQEKRDSVKKEKTTQIIQSNYLEEHAQEAHANIAIASSNVVGKMPGNSEQRDYLSQAYSDFIYAIIIEELGIIGAIFVALLYITLLFRAGRIASRCERHFPAYLTMGLAILLVMQAMINMLVAVGLFPVTGQPLPLISRGGTSTIITCVYFGMILSVSRYARKTPKDEEEADTEEEESAAEEVEDEAQKDFKNSDGME